MDQAKEYKLETAKVTRLRALRAFRGITVKEITEKTGLSRSTISNYETKANKIPWRSNYFLCEVLGVEKEINLTELVEVDKRWLHKGSRTFN